MNERRGIPFFHDILKWEWKMGVRGILVKLVKSFWGECMTTTRYDCMFQELLQIVLVRENWGREANACIHST